MDNGQGLKYDKDKLRYDLLPVNALEEIVKVYTIGAKKYDDRNWEKGLKFGRVFAALMRHAWAFWKGETYDKESGLNHMAHVAWNAIALLHFSSNCKYKSFDDRPSETERKEEERRAEDEYFNFYKVMYDNETED